MNRGTRRLAALAALAVLGACAPAPATPLPPVIVTLYPTVTPWPTEPPPSTPKPPPTIALPTLTPSPAPSATPRPTATRPRPTPTRAAAALPQVQAAPAPQAAARVAATPAQAAPPPSERSAPACPVASSSAYDVIPIEGAPYKNNALTDDNPDFRLSLLGYAPSAAAAMLVDYGGAADPDAPRLHGLFEPNREAQIARTHKHYDWVWNEGAGPPYGARGGVNSDWDASAIELRATPGEGVYPPERSPAIYGGGAVAMVLYAGPRELTLAYNRQDSVTAGYVVHLVNLCVDANLVQTYRASTPGGRRSGQLPAVRNNQRIGTALGDALVVAVRDRGGFLDPRSRKDWWR